jgi:hypothetical protein
MWGQLSSAVRLEARRSAISHKQHRRPTPCGGTPVSPSLTVSEGVKIKSFMPYTGFPAASFIFTKPICLSAQSHLSKQCLEFVKSGGIKLSAVAKAD